MAGHVNLEEQVDADFSRARRSGAASAGGNPLAKRQPFGWTALLGRGQRAARVSRAGLSRHEDGSGGADAASNRREAERE